MDTQKNRVGVNGELVVNGKAIIDNLNAGTIHGDKITANTLNANRLASSSITARELAAGAITADKIDVANLSAISSDLGDMRGGSLNIGNGMFTVSPSGALRADNAVIRGRIEADSGYFNGTVKASRIEGDVMKLVRMTKKAAGLWEATIRTDDAPMMVKPDFEVLWSGSEERVRNQLSVEFTIDGVAQKVSRFNHSYVVGLSRDHNNEIKTQSVHNVVDSFGWYVLPKNRAVRLRLRAHPGARINTDIPCLQSALLSPHDDEYKKLASAPV